MAERISRRPDELAQQCMRASSAVPAEPNWPTTAPIAMTLLTCSQNIETQLSVINSLESQLREARHALKPFVEAAHDNMVKVDQATDMLYGIDSPKKIQFGLQPKKLADTATGTPEQVVIEKLTDGTQPSSIWVDWSSVTGAVYEIQWFSDANLTQMVGSATVTASEMEVQGLERGKQYHFRVRAVRGGHTVPWSDQATRVANI